MIMDPSQRSLPEFHSRHKVQVHCSVLDTPTVNTGNFLAILIASSYKIYCGKQKLLNFGMTQFLFCNSFSLFY